MTYSRSFKMERENDLNQLESHCSTHGEAGHCQGGLILKTISQLLCLPEHPEYDDLASPLKILLLAITLNSLLFLNPFHFQLNFRHTQILSCMLLASELMLSENSSVSFF